MTVTQQKNNDIALEVKHVSKRFGEVRALDNVSLDFKRGEIHTLLGENGAGKTTLMNIIYGLYKPDNGEIFIDGERREIKNPKDSLNYGIGMVPQTFKLVRDMSILENVYLFMKNTAFVLKKEVIRKKIQELSGMFRFGIEGKIDVEIGDLSEGEKQKVEIMKVLSSESRIMLLDEATNVLAPSELDAFLEVIKNMNREGYTILYITHRLQEALAISDRISVFRKGKLVGTINGKEATYNKLTQMMVGAEFEHRYKKQIQTSGKPILSVKDIKVYDDRNIQVIQDLSFDLYPGEIVGLAGIEGNGSDHLAEALMGLKSLRSGSIHYLDNDISKTSTNDRMKMGITFIPSTNALVPQFTILKNSILDYPDKTPFSKRGMLNWKEIASHANHIVATYQVITPSVNLITSKLSGGNKQRLALGRKIEADPKLMIAYHPTKGLDISSQNFIYEKFTEMRDKGSTILFIGTDLDELYNICNRLMVIYRGEIAGKFDDIATISKIDIGLLMTGGSHYIDTGKENYEISKK